MFLLMMTLTIRSKGGMNVAKKKPRGKENLSLLVAGGVARLAQDIYKDAVAHGLWDDPTCALDNPEGMAYVRRRCALFVREEVCELWDAVEEPAAYAEELADVIIIAMSTAGHLGIDITSAILRKVEINKKRSFRHGKENASCSICETKQPASM